MSEISTEFEAKYTGICVSCGQYFSPGELIRYVDEQIEHVECVNVSVLREMCPECFTERSVCGDCLCVG